MKQSEVKSSEDLWWNICIIMYYSYGGVWGSVVVKALLVGRSRDRYPVVSLDFSVTYFLPTLALGSTQLLMKISTRNTLGVKAASA